MLHDLSREALATRRQSSISGSSAVSAVIGISHLREITGATVRALRYYEAAGLLTSCRTATGARAYTPAQADQALAIVHLRSAEVTLAEIRRILDPASDPAERRTLMADILTRKHAELEQRLHIIQSAIRSLEPVVEPPDRTVVEALGFPAVGRRRVAGR
jgi:DNA-binding transcriptional MerR regulator